MTGVNSPIVEVGLIIAFLLVVLGAVFAFIRLAQGPDLADRVVALDLVTILAVGFIALLAIASGESAYVDVAISIALVAFLGTVAFARYAEIRGSKGHSHEDLDD